MALLFPIVSLILGEEVALAICGSDIYILDIRSGELKSSHAAPRPHHNGAIRHLVLDRPSQHAITIGDDKKLKVWKLQDFSLLSTREIPKHATSLLLTKDDQSILVGDKSGDVFSYPFHPLPPAPTPHTTVKPEKKRRDGVASHENEQGTLVLGHASCITSMALSCDEKFIITADRDEHVRVSWYPQGWNIERFCLGHLKYVSFVYVLPSDPRTLISGGGDRSLHVWDWFSGTLKATIPVLDVVRPHLLVKGARERRKALARAIAKPKAKGGKRKEESDEGSMALDREGGADAMVEDIPPLGNTAQAMLDLPPEEEVFVVSKMASCSMSDGYNILVFSALGGTAIYYIKGDTFDEASVIHSLDLAEPVLDFVLAPSKDAMLVILDTSWRLLNLSIASQPPEFAASVMKPVLVLCWSSGEFVNSTDNVDDWTPLLSGLNSIRMTASSSDITSLDLYGDLTLFPKNVEDQDAEEPITAPRTTGSVPISGEKAQGTGGKATARQKLRQTLETVASGLQVNDEEDAPKKKARLDS
ncbi:hypothetical protein BS47DRAFT_1333879 [Hydnum rufescens UP504]|uniref:Transfer RNA methyltransferase 82 n=1 Tax=Hydnum rufescens UP504 TaxID=1448309 RepID=A0A9P6AIK6_9AGAM|nr:hypothetical protein BS47DRAFT_1333879 [Hydnum rufescens UP504]